MPIGISNNNNLIKEVEPIPNEKLIAVTLVL